MNIKEKIQQLAKNHKEAVIAYRRHLHQHPELSFQEHQTMDFIAQELKNLGLNPQVGVAGTGVVAYVEGRKPEKKTIALRADIDALPIKEANEVSYKSKHEGKMHACGHDAHTASLLGAAQILQNLREDFEGSVKLIFQPGEERLPGGASLMIKEGVLEAQQNKPAPQNIVGQHVMPLLPAGTVGFRSGRYMASADEIHVTVKGKGGHAAMPELCIDPVLITSHIIVALQQIVSRHSSPKMPTVLSFGRVIAEGATNIIPNEVHIQGTFRTYDEEWRFEAHRNMKKMAEGIAEAMGGSCDFEVRVGYPYLHNSEVLTERLRAKAVEFLGEEKVVDLDLWLAGEDFAYYSQKANACFYR